MGKSTTKKVIGQVISDQKYEAIKNYLSFFLFNLFSKEGLTKEVKHLPKYVYFLITIFQKQHQSDTYVLISNRLLRKLINQNIIKRIKFNLFYFKLIQCDFAKKFEIRGNKIIGKKSYGYRLTKGVYEEISKIPLTHSSPPSLHNGCDFINDTKQKNRTEKFENKVKEVFTNRWDDLIYVEQKPEYSFIQENTFQLEIAEEVFQWIEQQLKAGLKLKPRTKEFIKGGKRIVYLDKERILTPTLAEEWKNSAEKIKNKEYSFTCPPSTNRVYYNITSLPAELRNFLRYIGKPLVQLDYANFQPFLFIKFLKEKYQDPLPEDVVKYIELTSRGGFYQEIKNLLIADGVEIKTEDTFKLDFFQRVFFSTEKRKYQFRKTFDAFFPNVSKVITEAKKEKHSQLSTNLQKLEAKLVINTILKEIAEGFPGTFVIPVHDALLCETMMVDIVHELMKKRAKELIGFSPIVKEKLLINQIQ